MVKDNTNHPASCQPNHSTTNPNKTAKPPADHVGAPLSPRQQRQTSPSENEKHIQNSNNNEWQEIRRTNRKTPPYTPASTLDTTLETQNRYDLLSQDKQQEEREDNPQPHPNHKPPPIFIHGVINYDEMTKHIREIAEDEQYHTKSLANDVIKLNCTTPETYRKIIKHFKENNTYYHTYQLKEERAYRVAIRYLHHSTDITELRQELAELGHKARNIVNARNRITRDPLNLFFVDLEPAANNKEIYKITALQNKIIQVEPPRTNKNNIIQCMRCQQYGHSKTYCNKPFVCVKCGGSHNSTTCSKRRDTPAKCALCGGSHPANYKGCEHYHKLIQGNNPYRTSPAQTPTVPPTRYDQPSTSSTDPPQRRSYAEVTKNPENQNPDVNTTLNNFLAEFKGLITQLLNQNSMILSMLTTLINKTH